METLLTIKEADLKAIYTELVAVKSELTRIQSIEGDRALNKKQVCELMAWSGSTYERIRRNTTLPLPVYDAGGPKIDYNALMQWKKQWIDLQNIV